MSYPSPIAIEKPVIVPPAHRFSLFKFHFSLSSGLVATLSTLATNVLMIGLHAATGVLTARTLGATGRGQFMAMIMWPQFLALLMTLGLPSALIFHSKREPSALRDYLAGALCISLSFSCLAALAGWFVIPFWMAQYPPETIGFAQATMLLMPVAMLTEIAIGAFRAREEFTLYNRLRMLPPLLTLAGYLALLAADAMTPMNAAIATLAACSLIGVWFTLHHVVSLRVWRGRPLRAWRGLLNYGMRSSGSDLLSNLMMQVDALLVVGLLAPAQLGLYTVALSLARMLNVFQTAVVNVLFPKTASRPLAEVLEITGRAARACLLAAGGAGVVIGLAATPLLHWLYGAEFVTAVPVMRVLILEAGLSGVTMILMQPFLALERPALVSLWQGAGLLFACLALWLLIPRFGLLGAGLGLLAASALRLLCVVASYRWFLKTSPPRWWPNRTDAVDLIRTARTATRN